LAQWKRRALATAVLWCTSEPRHGLLRTCESGNTGNHSSTKMSLIKRRRRRRRMACKRTGCISFDWCKLQEGGISYQ
jgi:hypothetical protein